MPLDDNYLKESLVRFSGKLLRPKDPGYDAARAVHNGLIDKRPALIARCGGIADIADAVRVGRDLGLEVAVRAAATTSPVVRPSMAA